MEHVEYAEFCRNENRTPLPAFRLLAESSGRISLIVFNCGRGPSSGLLDCLATQEGRTVHETTWNNQLELAWSKYSKSIQICLNRHKDTEGLDGTCHFRIFLVCSERFLLQYAARRQMTPGLLVFCAGHLKFRKEYLAAQWKEACELLRSHH